MQTLTCLVFARIHSFFTGTNMLGPKSTNAMHADIYSDHPPNIQQLLTPVLHECEHLQ